MFYIIGGHYDERIVKDPLPLSNDGNWTSFHTQTMQQQKESSSCARSTMKRTDIEFSTTCRKVYENFKDLTLYLSHIQSLSVQKHLLHTQSFRRTNMNNIAHIQPAARN
jgi:hypothetical protein